MFFNDLCIDCFVGSHCDFFQVKSKSPVINRHSSKTDPVFNQLISRITVRPDGNRRITNRYRTGSSRNSLLRHLRSVFRTIWRLEILFKAIQRQAWFEEMARFRNRVPTKSEIVQTNKALTSAAESVPSGSVRCL